MTYHQLKGAISLPTIAIVTISLFFIGGFVQALANNSNADTEVAQKVAGLDATSAGVNARLDRIESKLDILLQAKRGTGTATN